MTGLFDYPKNSAFGRVVPKNRIYDHVGASTALKDLFVREVDQIVWAHKLAPETINLPATKTVSEIQVFHVTLKTDSLSDDALRAIDRAIPFPIIFELTHDGRVQVAAAHKRPSEADSTRWVTSDHLRSTWLPAATPRSPLPVALSLGALYDRILTALMPIEAEVGEDLATRMARLEVLQGKEREIARLEQRLRRETQFNMKVNIHGQLQEAQAAFDQMKKPGTTGGGN